ncbi:LysE family translocator [Actinomadura sp. NAK00032]|uniref:LysE family translocator n=1 Tax=Actinomadura sp. NAK00032 TaxID=2742128 RepID=UPI001C377BDD|nr:LysE family translocator [Actinomadura sp. NAK00032]
MTTFSAITSFALVAGILTIIPGMDTALVLRAAVTRGRRHAFATALGVNTGALVWGVAASVGAAAVLTASHLIYTALQMAGAAYMLWLGADMLWRSLRRHDSTTSSDALDQPGPIPSDDTLVRSWRQGMTTNLLNPKIGVFYMAMLPQFIPEDAPHLLMGITLAIVHDLEGLAWFALLIFGTHIVRRWLRQGRVHRVMDAITGTVLVSFGIKLALADK